MSDWSRSRSSWAGGYGLTPQSTLWALLETELAVELVKKSTSSCWHVVAEFTNAPSTTKGWNTNLIFSFLNEHQKSRQEKFQTRRKIVLDLKTWISCWSCDVGICKDQATE